MICIPMIKDATTFDVFVCLKDEGIGRIRNYDPAEVIAEKFGLSPRKMGCVIIGYATDAEEAELLRASKDQIPALLRKLSRGFAFKPKEGDNDLPYQKVKEN